MQERGGGAHKVCVQELGIYGGGHCDPTLFCRLTLSSRPQRDGSLTRYGEIDVICIHFE